MANTKARLVAAGRVPTDALNPTGVVPADGPAQRQAAGLPFAVHPHMLRHACGYKLANGGHDTRSLAHYLGYRNLRSRRDTQRWHRGDLRGSGRTSAARR